MLFGIIRAINNDKIKIVKDIIRRYPIIVNEKNDNGWTLLHFAADFGKFKIAKLLIKYGANVNDKNNSGATPLHLAVDSNSLEIVKLLLEHSANVNEKDNNGWTSLDIIVYYDNLEIVKLLLNHGAIYDKNGKTSLALDVEENKEIIEYITNYHDPLSTKEPVEE